MDELTQKSEHQGEVEDVLSELQEQLPEQNLAELEKGAGYGRW